MRGVIPCRQHKRSGLASTPKYLIIISHDMRVGNYTSQTTQCASAASARSRLLFASKTLVFDARRSRSGGIRGEARSPNTFSIIFPAACTWEKYPDPSALGAFTSAHTGGRGSKGGACSPFNRSYASMLRVKVMPDFCICTSSSTRSPRI